MKKVILFVFIIIYVPMNTAAQDRVVGALFSGGLGDSSFNDMTYAGMAKAKLELGVEIVYENAPGNMADTLKAISRLTGKKASFIILNIWASPDNLKEIGETFPNIRFMINDMAYEGAPNIASAVYGQHEGSFLAGALAAMMSESKTISFIGGCEIPTIHSFRVGFNEGAKYANPSIKINEVFIEKGADYSGFKNPAKGNEMALGLYRSGTDVIYGVAGLSGNGIIQAAVVQKKWVIGVDTDQDHMAPGQVLTSMMKRLDTVAYNEIQGFLENRFKSGIKYYGIAQGGISLSQMKYTRSIIPDAVHERLKKIENEIVEGKIKVTNYLTRD